MQVWSERTKVVTSGCSPQGTWVFCVCRRNWQLRGGKQNTFRMDFVVVVERNRYRQAYCCFMGKKWWDASVPGAAGTHFCSPGPPCPCSKPSTDGQSLQVTLKMGKKFHLWEIISPVKYKYLCVGI